MQRIGLILLILFLFSGQLSAYTSNGFYAEDDNQAEPITSTHIYSLEDKIVALSTIWSEVKYNFVNIDLLDFDLDSLYRVTLEKAVDTKNDAEFFKELERFLGALNDGHTQITRRPFGWDIYYDYIPANITEIDKKFYFSLLKQVPGVNNDLLSARIIEIDGIPTEQYVEEFLLPYICSSTEKSRWSAAATPMQQGAKNSYFRGKAQTLKGDIVEFSILRNGMATANGEYQNLQWKPIRIPRQKVITLEWVDNIAFLDIRAMTDDVPHILDSLMPVINKKATGLIVDLRYNRGGSSSVSAHIQQYFNHADSFLTFGAMIRTNDGYGRSQGNYRDEYKDFYEGKAFKTVESDTVMANPYITPIKCPVYFLIGPVTYSAAEDLLVNMYEVPGRPQFIGEETGGSTGAPLMVSLPNGGMARICTVKILYPYSKKPFIKHGVVPDIEIKQNLDDRIAGRDIVKEEAVKLMKVAAN